LNSIYWTFSDVFSQCKNKSSPRQKRYRDCRAFSDCDSFLSLFP